VGPMSMKDARRRFSALVKAAERGQTVTITRRGRKVARLVPAEASPSKGLPDLTEFRKSIKIKGKPLSQVVIDMRKEERF
jgi:prevent-host-death family protein